MITTPNPITTRERQVLNLLVNLHGEYGLDKQFTREAIQHVMDGPVAGSLAGLAMHDLITQRSMHGNLVYAVTENGFATYAGIDLSTA